jgi:hypothetical protein
MKKLKIFLAATILTLALAVTAFAGDMPCGITSSPPSQPATTVASDTETAPSSGTVSETTAVDPVTEIALNFIQSVLSLF